MARCAQPVTGTRENDLSPSFITLLTHIVEDTSGRVEVNHLYDAYHFEMQESGSSHTASKRATKEMIELIVNQAKNADKDPRGRRWSEGMIKVCLQWYCRSPQSYESFRESQYLIMPSKSTLIQYKNRVRQHVGFDKDMLTWMLDEAKLRNLLPEEYYGGIIIDEMSIKSDIQMCKNGDVIELSGFTDLGEEGNFSNTMRKGKNEKI
ncbi:hypothetical protein MAR_012926 [Mya arenaria]|uniref:Uncharacterized protein n=1 Tax=Mya arenaria TaxID=6604 RepID=A0ABY7G1Q9_MYAAR|nr:hypothetical protein MAR_012926 [Mya arenaria]